MKIRLPRTRQFLSVSAFLVGMSLTTSFMDNTNHNYDCDSCVIVEPNYNEGIVQFIVTGTSDELAQLNIVENENLVLSKEVELRNEITGIDIPLNKFNSGVEYTVSVTSSAFNAENNFRIK